FHQAGRKLRKVGDGVAHISSPSKRGPFEARPKRRRYFDGLHRVNAGPATDAGNLAVCEYRPIPAELEGVGERFAADLVEPHIDIEHVFKERRLEIIARRGNPREADGLALPLQLDRDAKR